MSRRRLPSARPSQDSLLPEELLDRLWPSRPAVLVGDAAPPTRPALKASAPSITQRKGAPPPMLEQPVPEQTFITRQREVLCAACGRKFEVDLALPVGAPAPFANLLCSEVCDRRNAQRITTAARRIFKRLNRRIPSEAYQELARRGGRRVYPNKRAAGGRA